MKKIQSLKLLISSQTATQKALKKAIQEISHGSGGHLPSTFKVR